MHVLIFLMIDESESNLIKKREKIENSNLYMLNKLIGQPCTTYSINFLLKAQKSKIKPNFLISTRHKLTFIHFQIYPKFPLRFQSYFIY